MQIIHVPAQKPKYDPYEEDVAGTHDGATVKIICGSMVLNIQEMKSGIGDYLVVQGISFDEKTRKISFGIDDDGKLFSVDVT